MLRTERKSSAEAAIEVLSIIKNLDPKARKRIVRTLNREGAFGGAALGAACGPASHNF